MTVSNFRRLSIQIFRSVFGICSRRHCQQGPPEFADTSTVIGWYGFANMFSMHTMDTWLTGQTSQWQYLYYVVKLLILSLFSCEQECLIFLIWFCPIQQSCVSGNCPLEVAMSFHVDDDCLSWATSSRTVGSIKKQMLWKQMLRTRWFLWKHALAIQQLPPISWLKSSWVTGNPTQNT